MKGEAREGGRETKEEMERPVVAVGGRGEGEEEGWGEVRGAGRQRWKGKQGQH